MRACKCELFALRMRFMSADPARPALAAVPAPQVPPPAAANGQPRRWTSAAILGDAREALIEHAGAVYRLRLTASGKLILTK
jgi:hemin uptake protein HemP